MQTVPQTFHDAAQGSIIPIDWGLRVSFTKEFDDDVTFFTLNSSVLNGADILAPSDDNPIQEWDFYEYQDFSDRVIAMDWSRSIDFPYSVQASLADITLNNYDDYFTPNSLSPIQQYILPKRPLRILAGFKNVSTIPQFVGITQGMPEIDEESKTVSFHALDFLSEMFAMPLTETVAMSNITTDVVLGALFQQFGLSSAQYSLAKGRNKIPFLFFERGKNAGEAFRELMQAEMGKLWLDEQGIIRFEQRLMAIQTPVMTFNESNIVSIRTTGDDEIINTVRIMSDVRKVQNFQPIYTNAQEEGQETTAQTDPFIVPASGTAFFPDALLDDPALSATTPTIGRKKDTSWFTATDLNGNAVTSNISITLSELRTGSFVMLFDNDNAFPVIINQVEIWGEPARVVDEIRYEAYDEESREKYGEKVLDIQNNFFGNYSNCDSFAEFVLDGYKEFASVIEMEVKGDPSLQLGDTILVNYKTYDSTYKVIGTTVPLREGEFTHTIRARHYTPREWFILNQSVLNGTDLLAP